MKLSGATIAGMSSKVRGRVENDYYATPFWATEAILEREPLNGSIWEPACGEGHMGKVLNEYYPDSKISCSDLVQRQDIFNIGIRGGIDFLTIKPKHKVNNVITNPPFKFAKEFVDKALEVSTDKVLMFLKLQFLEGTKRKNWFTHTPLESVYVFSKRVATLWNGSDVNEKGKPWASTMCYAWFVWNHHKNPDTEPVIRWI